jgi:hypothetical protein
VVLSSTLAAVVPAMAESTANEVDSACHTREFADYGFVSASSVEGLQGTVSTVRPEVTYTYPGDPNSPSDYLKPMGPTGFYGLIGPWGPLGVTGPAGRSVWHPARWLSGTAGWREFAEVLGWWDGPMSDMGPLGQAGPLSETAYCTTLPTLGHPSGQTFSKQLQAGGVWGVLGPAGPLGALGPLGPLGPVGAHGYRWDSGGSGGYLDDHGAVVRAVEVPYGDGTLRRYPLYEFYQDAQARAVADNDTSFMVETTSMVPGGSVDYPFTSAESQWVTVLVTPMYLRYTLAEVAGCVLAAIPQGFDYPAGCGAGGDIADDFTVEILDPAGRVIASSASAESVDWVQFKVPAGSRLTARVHYRERAPYLGYHDGFRLFVTGSTGYLPAGTDITGGHQRTGS